MQGFQADRSGILHRIIDLPTLLSNKQLSLPNLNDNSDELYVNQPSTPPPKQSQNEEGRKPELELVNTNSGTLPNTTHSSLPWPPREYARSRRNTDRSEWTIPGTAKDVYETEKGSSSLTSTQGNEDVNDDGEEEILEEIFRDLPPLEINEGYGSSDEEMDEIMLSLPALPIRKREGEENRGISLRLRTSTDDMLPWTKPTLQRKINRAMSNPKEYIPRRSDIASQPDIINRLLVIGTTSECRSEGKHQHIRSGRSRTVQNIAMSPRVVISPPKQRVNPSTPERKEEGAFFDRSAELLKKESRRILSDEDVQISGGLDRDDSYMSNLEYLGLPVKSGN